MSNFFLLLSLAFLVQGAFGIGEGLDVNALTKIFLGLGNMFGDTPKTVDVSRKMMMGRWHQMYKAAINFDVFRTNMYCPVAYFRPNSVMGSDGFSMQEAYRVIAKDGPLETYKRDVTKQGPGQFWMYTEEYFYPRQFYIIAAGPEQADNSTSDEAEEEEADEKRYEYLIVTDSNRLALMVFARDPLEFRGKYNNEVLDFLKNEKFGDGVFWNAPRAIYQEPDCDWPTEEEVFARRVLKNQQTANQQQYGGSGGNTLGLANAIGALTTNTENVHRYPLNYPGPNNPNSGFVGRKRRR